MNTKTRVVIAGRNRESLDQLGPMTREYFGIDPVLRHITNGHADPLHGHAEAPDLLIVELATDWREQLGSICARPAATRPTILVVGPATEVDAMRLAMRAGASDYLSTPVDRNEFMEALSRIEYEERRHDPEPCRWTSVIGAKGGIGASMLACNLALLIHQEKKQTALLDLDLQSGSLASYLDLEPRNNFQDAVEAAQDLDQLALQGFMTKTRDGLHLLAAPEELVLPEQIPVESLVVIAELISSSYEHVIADLSRHIDHVVASGIERSDDIFLVMEQSVAALRETVRILDMLCRDFGLSESQIHVVINRHTKNTDVTERHIRKNLGDIDIQSIPNDFRLVRESLDVGVPVVRHAPRSAIARALKKLAGELTGQEPQRESLVRSLTGMLRN